MPCKVARCAYTLRKIEHSSTRAKCLRTDAGGSRSSVRERCLVKVGGQTGKDCLLTWADGVKVADRRDRTRNLSLRKRCTNHCTTGPHSLVVRHERSVYCEHSRVYCKPSLSYKKLWVQTIAFSPSTLAKVKGKMTWADLEVQRTCICG